MRCARDGALMVRGRLEGEEWVCAACGSVRFVPVKDARSEHALWGRARVESGFWGLLSDEGEMRAIHGRVGRRIKVEAFDAE